MAEESAIVEVCNGELRYMALLRRIENLEVERGRMLAAIQAGEQVLRSHRCSFCDRYAAVHHEACCKICYQTEGRDHSRRCPASSYVGPDLPFIERID